MKTRFGRLYKKQKGFSLIELLAVILILGIVALIAVPTVNKVIENSRTGAAEDSAKQFVASIGDKLVMEKLHYNIIRNGDYSISELLDLNLNISGTVPDAGFVSISNYQVVDYQLQYGDYVVYPPKKNNVIVDNGQNNGGTDNPGNQTGSQIGENGNQNGQNGSLGGGSSTGEGEGSQSGSSIDAGEVEKEKKFVAILNANDFAEGTLTRTPIYNGFDILATSTKPVSVINKSVVVNGLSFVRTISLGGEGAYDSYRSIKFIGSAKNEIKVIASSSSSNAYLALATSSGIVSKQQISSTPKIYTFIPDSTSIYNFYSTSADINIYYIETTLDFDKDILIDSSSGGTSGESSSGTASDPIVFKPDLNSWDLASNSTYVASVYYNPSTNKKCTESDYLSNKSKADSNSKVLSEGCMIWHVYSDDNNGNLKMLLDHSVDMRSQSDINVVMQYLAGKWQVEPMLFSIEDLSNVIGVNLIDEYNKKLGNGSITFSYLEVYNIKNSQSAFFSKAKWLMSNPYLIFKTSSNPVLPQPVVYNSNNDATILGIIHNYLRKSLTALSSGSLSGGSLSGGSLSGGTIGGGTIGGQIGGGSSSGGLIGGDSSCTGESYYQAGFFLSSPSISDMTFVLGRTDASHYIDDCLNLYSTTDGIVGAYAVSGAPYGIRPVVMVNKSIFE